MQMLPWESSALDSYANTKLMPQCKDCRGKCNQTCHWKEESGSKGTWKSSLPRTGGLATAWHAIQKS